MQQRECFLQFNHPELYPFGVWHLSDAHWTSFDPSELPDAVLGGRTEGWPFGLVVDPGGGRK